MMIRLDGINGDVLINPQQVISVTRDYHGRYLLLRTTDGELHEIQRRYGESIYDSQSRILKLLNGEMKS